MPKKGPVLHGCLFRFLVLCVRYVVCLASTGKVTVSYGDELVRVEMNASSEDEFSEIEETEEQRILRESGAQIIEDDDDDDDEDIVLHSSSVQQENQARDSVIQAPVANSGVRVTEAADKTATNSTKETDTPNVSRTSTPKPDAATQKKKISKLEESIRKISNIREKESHTESLHVDGARTESNKNVETQHMAITATPEEIPSGQQFYFPLVVAANQPLIWKHLPVILPSTTLFCSYNLRC